LGQRGLGEEFVPDRVKVGGAGEFGGVLPVTRFDPGGVGLRN
jgi:hypothetical protein